LSINISPFGTRLYSLVSETGDMSKYRNFRTGNMKNISEMEAAIGEKSKTGNGKTHGTRSILNNM